MMKAIFTFTIALLLWAPVLPAWAVIEYVGGQVGGFNGTLSSTTVNFALTGGLAVTPAAGDLVVVGYCIVSDSNDTQTITDPAAANYTELGVKLYANDSNDTNLAAGYKFMTGTPD